MKKLLAVLMLVAMLFSFAAAEDDPITFAPSLLNAMDYSAAEWWSSYTYKTAFAVMAAADLSDITQQGIYDSAKEGILNDAIYVSINDDRNILTAFFFGDTQVIGVMYMPEAKLAMILVEEGITPSMASAAMLAIEDEYVQVKQTDFMTLLNALAGD